MISYYGLCSLQQGPSQATQRVWNAEGTGCRRRKIPPLCMHLEILCTDKSLRYCISRPPPLSLKATRRMSFRERAFSWSTGNLPAVVSAVPFAGSLAATSATGVLLPQPMSRTTTQPVCHEPRGFAYCAYVRPLFVGLEADDRRIRL